MEEEADCITDLQKQIESQLEKDGNKRRFKNNTGNIVTLTFVCIPTYCFRNLVYNSDTFHKHLSLWKMCLDAWLIINPYNILVTYCVGKSLNFSFAQRNIPATKNAKIRKSL